jgi:hypothetical protein
MKFNRELAVVAALAALLPCPASAKPKTQDAQSNALINALSACRTVTNEQARLACYDGASARLAEAVQSKALVVLDQQEVRQTRRSLFGFSVPNIPLFRGESGGDSGELEAVIARGTPIGAGKWQIKLEDGAVWQTNETFMGLNDPRSGQKIVIKRGALGNYFLRINGQRGIRGRRVE